MSRTNRFALALCATLSLAAGSAHAIGDVMITNDSSSWIHPYFKTNCWSRSIIDSGPDEWVFFGTVVAGTSFNWNDLYLILDPKCKNPVVKVTYVRDGDPAPHQTIPEGTVVLQYDATKNTQIKLGDRVVVTDVLPF